MNFSTEQERNPQNVDEKHVRQAWQEYDELSKLRSLWNQQPYIDSTILNSYPSMNDSSGTKHDYH